MLLKKTKHCFARDKQGILCSGNLIRRAEHVERLGTQKKRGKKLLPIIEGVWKDECTRCDSYKTTVIQNGAVYYRNLLLEPYE